MERKKFLQDLSGSAVQIIVTQVISLVVFYLVSRFISKELFGFYNWATAVGTTIIAILSLGMDFVYIHRVAAERKEKETIAIHFFHRISTGILFVLATVLFIFLFPKVLPFNVLFLLVIINQVTLNVSKSIQLCLKGHEKYKLLGKLAIMVSIAKIIAVASLFILHQFTIQNVILILIFSYLLEFLIAYYYAEKTIHYYILPKIYFKEYKAFIRESLPQLGTVLFDSALARIDWILMGVLATVVVTANYTFAFRLFEISKLPYLIIAPILLTRFSKLFRESKPLQSKEINNIDNLFRVEIFIAVLVPVVGVVIWSGFIDLLTANKYGAINQITYTVLALCIPLHYSTNFLWTLAFAQGQLRQIFKITAVTSILNIVLNVAFIPLWNAEGAAIAFLVTTVLQIILYLIYTHQKQYKFKLQILASGVLMGIISIGLVYWLPVFWVWKGLLSLGIYMGFTFGFKFISLETIKKAFI